MSPYYASLNNQNRAKQAHDALYRLQCEWSGYLMKEWVKDLDSETLEALLSSSTTPYANASQQESMVQQLLAVSFPIARCLYLAPFDDRRQDAFTQRWFQHRHSTDYSQELMREVRAHHLPRAEPAVPDEHAQAQRQAAAGWPRRLV